MQRRLVCPQATKMGKVPSNMFERSLSCHGSLQHLKVAEPCCYRAWYQSLARCTGISGSRQHGVMRNTKTTWQLGILPF